MLRKCATLILLLMALGIACIWIWGYWPGVDVADLELRVAECDEAYPKPHFQNPKEFFDALWAMPYEGQVCQRLRFRLDRARNAEYDHATFRVPLGDYAVDFSCSCCVWAGHSWRRFWNVGRMTVHAYVPMRNEMPTRGREGQFEFAGILLWQATCTGKRTGSLYREYLASFHLSLPLLLCLVYPTVVLLRPVRQRWRRRHGLCGRCGYNIANLTEARCPECGEATTKLADESHESPN